MKLTDLPEKYRMEAYEQMKPRANTVAPSSTTTVYINPIGKPRMTQRDKWAKRPAVLRYREFADEMRLRVKDIPENASQVSWKAFFPIPDSWTKKKKAEMKGKLHRQKPDRDNVDKAILDALFKDDSGIATGYLEKRWDDGNGPRIEISIEVI